MCIYQFVPERYCRNFEIGSSLLQDCKDQHFDAVFPLCSTMDKYILQSLLNYFLYCNHIESKNKTKETSEKNYRRGTHSLLVTENECEGENCSKHLEIGLASSPSSPRYNLFIKLDSDFEKGICICQAGFSLSFQKVKEKNVIRCSYEWCLLH